MKFNTRKLETPLFTGWARHPCQIWNWAFKIKHRHDETVETASIWYDAVSTQSHYNDVIMSAMTSQITSLTTVYSSVYSGTDQRKRQTPRHWHCEGNSPVTGEFPTQMASNAENVSIWWRHHGLYDFVISAISQAVESINDTGCLLETLMNLS